MPSVLRLEVTEFTDLRQWRWVLTDAATSAFLADRDVRLDPGDWQFDAFTDLRGYVSWHAAPDEHYASDEARIVMTIAHWITDRVLGTGIANALVRQGPATVQVIIPAGAEALAYLPLDIARVGGRPLADHGVALVMCPQPAPDSRVPEPAPAPAADRLRVLGLFSLPEGSGRPLSLRRERQSLVQLIESIAASGRAADIRVLQYGVTRDRLRDVLEEAEGWDIIHVSGHGSPGELLLETAAGARDLVTADDLADMLGTTRGRTKLVTVAVCWSAALTAAEQRRLLHLPVADNTATQDNSATPDTERPVATLPGNLPVPGALATRLADRLGCAVLAMRYPVPDEFAIALSGKLYELLARQGQPLAQAVAMTMKDLRTSATRHPELSMAAPAIFGATAADLRLRAPGRHDPARYDPALLNMAGFPPQPDRFVGRTGVMARASAALAIESGVPGVLLHGMPGGGKTACALELAYGHEESFDRLVWYKVPDEGMAIDGALTNFALTLERFLDGFQMIDKLSSDDSLSAFQPRLTELMKRSRLLIVIDNAESLLTDAGAWRDQRWESVVGALTAHTGFGRIIVTTRRVPTGPQSLRTESVDALTADEALLLARELPSLHRLIHGEVPGIAREVSRKLAVGVLATAHGHPKLLELANGQAAAPDRLATLIESGNQAWQDQGGLPDGFFTTGTPAVDPGDYLNVLAAWTRVVTDTLAPGERDLFWFLCCLEEPDRIRLVLDGNWADLRKRLDRDGQSPDPDALLSTIVNCGLASVRGEAEIPDHSYAIHPCVAAVGRADAGVLFRDCIDVEAAAFWRGLYKHALGDGTADHVDTGLLVRAGLAAGPYLARQQQWDDAGVLLHNAFARDQSQAIAAVALPAMTRIAEHAPRHAVSLTRILRQVDRAAAEALMRASLNDAVARHDYRSAARAAGQLSDVCLDSGRLDDALTLASQQIDYGRKASYGPWSQILDQTRMLRVQLASGEASHVFSEIQRIRDQTDLLPTHYDADDPAPPWQVLEVLLETSRSAALQLGEWSTALALNAELVSSLRDRRASPAAVARAQFSDYGPLLSLGHANEALDLLRDCRHAFEEVHDIQMLSKTLTALAAAEEQRGHSDQAIRLEREALRHKYTLSDTASIAVSYHNLGFHLRRHARQPTIALAAHLASSFIYALSGIGGTRNDGAGRTVSEAADDLREFGAAAEPPANISGLCRCLDDIPGTDLSGLIAKLSPDLKTGERVLRDLIAQARELAATPTGAADAE